MANLFGLDIAGIVNDAIASAGNLRPVTLTKTISGTRTSGSLTGGNNPTTTTHTCQGFRDSSVMVMEGTNTRTTGRFVSILGASISPPTAPESGDTVTIDGETFRINGVPEVDPANALYRCAVEG